jgi:hypothetical protein
MLARGCDLRREKLKPLLILSTLAIALNGCGLPTNRDLRAYDACVARHPWEIAVCEGPRQAYELNPTGFEARAAAIGPSAGSGHEAPSAETHPLLAPVPLHQDGEAGYD